MSDGFDMVKIGVALFAILNPFGNAPLFLSLTADDDDAQRARVALIATFAILVTLVIVALAGRQLLAVFGISVDDLRVAGGLVVLLIGLSMLHAKPSGVHTSEDDLAHGKQKESPAVVPLAIPMVAGPGAMATVIVSGETAETIGAKALLLAAIAVNALIVYVAFRVAVPLQRRLGVSGMNIVVRVMGLILAAIAVDMMASGLRAEFPVLASALRG
jgi:multiple antibiotic resistance protein